MTLSESLTAQAIRELYDRRCANCGCTKKSGESFCHGCYFALPATMRPLLYRPMSEGYPEFYAEAKEWLAVNKVRNTRASQSRVISDWHGGLPGPTKS